MGTSKQCVVFVVVVGDASLKAFSNLKSRISTMWEGNPVDGQFETSHEHLPATTTTSGAMLAPTYRSYYLVPHYDVRDVFIVQASRDTDVTTTADVITESSSIQMDACGFPLAIFTNVSN